MLKVLIKKRKEFLLLVAVTAFCVLFLEIFARLFLEDTPLHSSKPFNKYGWSAHVNKSVPREVIDHENFQNNFTLYYFKYGFKRWGNVNTKKTKLLILGDSFTEMIYVPNGKEWYSYLENVYTNVEFFVYGMGAYGSLQEYMILDDYIDIIKPDILLWQFCGNDFRDNFFKYERKNYPFANNRLRPYWEDGRVVYRFPLPFGNIRKLSKLFDRFMDKWHFNYLSKLKSRTDFRKIKKNNSRGFEKNNPHIIKDSVYITTDILSMARKRAGEIPCYLFSNASITWKEEYVCKKAGFTLIPDFKKHILSKKGEGIKLHIPKNVHWNLEGNRIVGEYFVNYFRDKIVPMDDP